MAESARSGLKLLDVDELHFDPGNPRIPKSIEAANDQAVLRWMLEDASLTDLMRSIATQGYFEGEPLLVAPRDGGGYIVIEGNRRLAALKLLLEPHLAQTRRRTVAAIADEASYRPNQAPVVAFESPEEVQDYLGYRHVTGIKPWEPLAKARYVERMWMRLAKEFPSEPARATHIANVIGSRRDYVARTLAAVRMYEILVISGVIGDDIAEDDVDFSLLTVALGRSAIVEWLGLESGQDYELKNLSHERLVQLATWMFARDDSGATVLGESRNMSKLAEIVKVPDAVHTLARTGDIDRAARDSGYASADLLTHLQRAREALAKALQTIPDVDYFDTGDLEILVQISRSARSLHEALRALGGSAFEDIE